MIVQRRAIIIEGPAGSGKTFLYNELAYRYPTLVKNDILPEIDRPRAYIGSHGQWHAQLKDYRSSIHMLMTDEDGVALVDRWCISQIVYDHIRRDQLTLDYGHLQRAFTISLLNLSAAWYDHCARTDLFPIKDLDISILLLIVCSPSATVNKLRQSQIDKGRVYPYKAESEAILYKQAAFTLSQYCLDPVSTPSIPSVRARVDVVPLYTTSLKDRLAQASGAVERHINANLAAIPELQTVNAVSGSETSD